MPALGYEERFADAVEQGRKRQTLRKRRKVPIKVGDILHHFTGWRTKACKRLREGIEDYCTETFPLRRTKRGMWSTWGRSDGWFRISARLIEHIARLDGFANVEEFEDWFDDHKCGPDELLDVVRW